MPLHLRFIRRQFSGAGSQTGIFLFCVALSMLTLSSLRGFGRSVNEALERDARSIHGADVIVHAHRDFSPGVIAAAEDLSRRGEARFQRTWEFYSMAAGEESGQSLLVRVKAVGRAYPWYGRVDLASGRPLGDVLRPGSIVVEESLLGRIGAGTGDTVLLGGKSLEIVDVVTAEDARPVTIFSLGPRAFVASADLDRLGLVGRGSRVEHRLLFKTEPGTPLEPLTAALGTAAVPDAERIETFLTARSGTRRFFDNFLFFLTLLGTFTLVLAGIGIQSALGALLRERRETVAVMKALGASRRFVVVQFLMVTMVLGAFGTALGILASYLLQSLLIPLFRDFIPEGITSSFSWTTLLEGAALGILATCLFALLPLWRLGEISPAAIFRRERAARQRSLPYWVSLAAIFSLCALLVLRGVRDLETGFSFLGGFTALIVLSALGAEGLLRLVKRLPVRSLALRQAVRGLFRPGNATRPVIITLTAALSVILAIGLVERNLEEEFVQSYPEDAPNLFFLDIQPGQRPAVADMLGPGAEFYPIVTSQVIAINGEAVDRKKEREKARDNFGRDFYLTYRTHLLSDERLTAGPGLFDPDVEGPQVSLLEEVLEMAAIDIGDRITFRVQGVPLEAVVTSMRRRTESSPRPFFYFVFPPEFLAEAPQTIFAAVRTDPGSTLPLQNRIARAFPNVSVIDAGAAAIQVGGIIARVSRIVGFFTLLGITAGLLITVSSVLATRRARIREAVYYRVLGGQTGFVLRVFAYEGILIGLASGFLALFFAQGITWGIASWQLDIPFRPYWAGSLVAVAAVAALTVAAGLLASRSVLRQRPAAYLREKDQ